MAMKYLKFLGKEKSVRDEWIYLHVQAQVVLKRCYPHSMAMQANPVSSLDRYGKT